MRLLKCDERNSVVYFTADLSDSEAVNLKYAILSHTWGPDDEEVLFEDVINGQAEHKTGYKKIVFCAQLARQHGLEYFWIDTCCIDKKNHAELSKSLISMFRWYSNAEKCYVFLSDVPNSDQAGADWKLDFRSSRWFRRGWTLQELLAPAKLEFYSKHRMWLGTRVSLERDINETTHIPIGALRGQALTEFTLRERWQWQEGRETREPEDIVYSLFGVFDISMPVLYGEGSVKARQRLEDAITAAQKGAQHRDFAITFSLSEAVETETFIARETELREIRNGLRSDGSRKVLIVQGLGGIGKTQLAIAYAKRYKEDYSTVFWINANDASSVTSNFVKMGRRILRQHPLAARTAGLDLTKSPAEIVDAVKSWLSLPMNCHWLMICDNYDNPKVAGNTDPTAFQLRDYFPDAYQGAILITTRSSEVNFGHRMKIEKLNDVQDSLEILENSSGRKNLASDQHAMKLAKKLDGLPLALVTTGAYLSQSTITCAEYLDFYEHSWAILQDMVPALDTYENRTLFSTWQVSFDSIERRNSLAANLLRLWAYFDNKDLWFELLNHNSKEDFEWWQNLTKNRITFESCMKMLCTYGLAEPNASNEDENESTGYSVHACVHSWMLNVLNTEHDNDFTAVAMSCVTRHLRGQQDGRCPGSKTKHTLLSRRRLLGHAERCSTYFYDITIYPEITARLLTLHHTVMGDLLDDQAKRAEAEAIYRRLLVQTQRAFGPDDPSTLYVIEGLSKIYRNQGNLQQAETLMRRALTGREVSLGYEHRSTLRAVYYLGAICLDQGNIEEAEQLLRRALQAQENLLGEDHPETIETSYRIGVLCGRQGNLEETEYRCKQSLEGRIKVLGQDDLSTLQNMAALGFLYMSQGKLVEAESTYRRAVEGYGRALGPDDPFPARAIVLRALGEVYRDQGKLAEAEQTITLAIKQSQDIPRQNNPWKLSTYASLGIVHVLQGRMVEADQCYQRALEGYDGMHYSQKSTVDRLGQMLST